MIPTVTSPTLKQIIDDRMRSMGISRHQLIRQIGYTNVSKGLRRLDTYLSTLDAPCDDFVSRLLDTLVINKSTYLRAYISSFEAIEDQVIQSFTPSIRLNIDFSPQPWFAAQLINAKCTVPVPVDVKRLAFQKEITAVIALYNDRVSKLPFAERVIGFKYYRSHDCCLVFDRELACVKISSSHTFQQRPYKIGDRLLEALLLNGIKREYEIRHYWRHSRPCRQT